MRRLIYGLLWLPVLAWGNVLNPDVTADNTQSTICVPGYTKSVRPSSLYTNGVKAKLMREAGIPADQMSTYELDHIIPLALGGHPRALANLQLQPWEGSEGALRKDKLERKLQCLVCTGRVGLQEAQEAILEDWPHALRRYGHLRCTGRRIQLD